MKNLKPALAAAALCAFVSVPAQAVVVTGSSYGEFSNPGSCDSSGSNVECVITGEGSFGANTVFRWGERARNRPRDSSFLQVFDINWNVNTDANDVQIARIDWFNNATENVPNPTVTLTIFFGFTAPNASSDSEAFALSISNPTNPAPDLISGFSLTDLTNLQFTLNGVTVSDLRYTASGGSTFSNFVWTNPERNTGSLSITADFRSAQVPVPGSLALLGLGALAAGLAGRRAARK